WHSFPGRIITDAQIISLKPLEFLAAGEALYRYDTETGVWHRLRVPGVSQAFEHVCAASGGKIIFVAGANGLFISRDRGAHWTNPRLTRQRADYFYPYNVAVDLLNRRIVVNTGDEIFATTDNGKTWTLPVQGRFPG